MSGLCGTGLTFMCHIIVKVPVSSALGALKCLAQGYPPQTNNNLTLYNTKIFFVLYKFKSFADNK